MGLGKAGRGGIDLKAARKKRDELRALIDSGLDPLAERRKRRAEQEAKKTFAEVAKLALAKKVGGWKGGERSSSFAAWVKTIDREAKALHQRPVDEISVDEVKRVVAAKWGQGFHNEARMGLARIATVFDFARAHGWRSADNPAAWSIFKHIAPDQPKAAKHHPSLDWREAPAVMARLRQSEGMSGLALEFAILTGARIGEALKAEWREIDPGFTIWTIPPERMKRAIEHTVPLSSRAAAILTALHERRGRNRLIFPGARPGGTLSRSTVLDMSNRISDGKASCHGWRVDPGESWMAHSPSRSRIMESGLGVSVAAGRRRLPARAIGRASPTDNGTVVEILERRRTGIRRGDSAAPGLTAWSRSRSATPLSRRWPRPCRSAASALRKRSTSYFIYRAYLVSGQHPKLAPLMPVGIKDECCPRPSRLPRPCCAPPKAALVGTPSTNPFISSLIRRSLADDF